MEECLEWINERINYHLINVEEKMNFQAFKQVLESSDAFENHSGRFLLIKKGQVWDETFGSAEDTFSEEFDDDWILFRIPMKDDKCFGATIFASNIAVGKTNGDFDEINIPVELTTKKPPSGYTGPQVYQGNFMVDTGASHSSCPCYVGDLKEQSLPVYSENIPSLAHGGILGPVSSRMQEANFEC